MKAVIVDLGHPGWLSLFGVAYGKGKRLLWLERHPLAVEGPSVWHLVQARLESHAARTWPICWVPSREHLGTVTLTLPPIPKRELIKVLPREVTLATEATQGLSTSFALGDFVEEKGGRKQEIVCTYMPQARLEEGLAQMRELGLSPRWVLPEMAAHLQLLKGVMTELKGELSGTVLFEVGPSRISMTIYRGLSWGLERVFSFRPDEEETISDEALARISVELNRTLQFFKQRFRHSGVDRLVLFGQTDHQQVIGDHIKSNHALQVLVPEQTALGNRVDLGACVDAPGACLSTHLLPLHLVPALGERSDLDLIPQDFQDRTRFKRRAVGFAVAYGLLLAAIVFSTLYFKGIGNDYRTRSEQLDQTLALQRTQNEQFEQVKKRRALFYRLSHYNLWPKRYTLLISDFVRQLTLMAVPEVHFTELTFEPKPHGADFVLKGYIAVSDSIAAQSIFIRLYDQIKELPELVTLDSSNVKVNAASDEASPPYQGAGATRKSAVELYFSINGELEWP